MNLGFYGIAQIKQGSKQKIIKEKQRIREVVLMEELQKALNYMNSLMMLAATDETKEEIENVILQLEKLKIIYQL